MTARPVIANAMAASGKAPVYPSLMPHAPWLTETIANKPTVNGLGSPKKHLGTSLKPNLHPPLGKICAGQCDRRSQYQYSLNGLLWKCELEGSRYR